MPSNTRTLADIKGEEKTLRDRVARLVDDQRSLSIKIDVDGDDDGLQERLGTVERGIDKASTQLATLGEEHRAEIRRMADAGAFGVEAGVDLSNGATERQDRDRSADVAPHRQQALDGALRTLERCQGRDTMSNRAATSMERVVRHDDPAGLIGRYIAAVGDPAYNSAFGKLLQYGTTASMRMTVDEMTAMQRVSQVESERAMVDGTGASGGFAIPIEIDPTILLTSSGALNPIRSVADVRQMAGYTLRLVSADTPAATYAAELTEVGDGSPTLVQPTVNAQKGHEFIPFSVELDQDWVGLQQDLLRLLSDGKDILDATMFLTGTGTAQPVGIFAASGGLTTTQRVQTATASTTVIGDLYALKAALASTRFWTTATYAANPTTWDVFFRFVGGGNTTEPEPFTNGRGGAFLGTPKVEWSTMQTGTTTTGQKTAIVGDWSGFVIGDRIGSQVELIPQVFGATSRYPTGQRGIYYWWRSGTCVSKPNAFRYLETK
jgi:HK97 family phage major capsid protein